MGKVIAITGYPRAGKTTVAAILAAELGYRFLVYDDRKSTLDFINGSSGVVLDVRNWSRLQQDQIASYIVIRLTCSYKAYLRRGPTLNDEIVRHAALNLNAMPPDLEIATSRRSVFAVIEAIHAWLEHAG